MTACETCRRRTRLIAALAGHLDHLHAERGLFDELFALDDGDLVAALARDDGERERLLLAVAGASGSAGPDDESQVAFPPSEAALCRHDPAYPPALNDLAGAPALLFVAGVARLPELLAEPAVAIVGARRASAYGLEVARSLGRGLSAAGVTVVSGMALGVDSAAHEGALDAGGRTIAVLGGGTDVAYPATKRGLHARLRAEAAVVSELPPGFGPRRWTFPARNRIIAALAAATVVVEAASRSGALITARVARELGRDVAAVPGQVTSPLARGPNHLLRDGAHVVDGPQSVLDLLYGVGVRRAERRPPPDLEPRLARTLARVREGASAAAARSEGGGELPAETLAALGELELRGLVRRTAGGGWVAVA